MAQISMYMCSDIGNVRIWGDNGLSVSFIPQVIYIRRTPNHRENNVDYVALNHYYIHWQIRTQKYNITTNSLPAPPTRFVYGKTPAACLDSPRLCWPRLAKVGSRLRKYQNVCVNVGGYRIQIVSHYRLELAGPRAICLVLPSRTGRPLGLFFIRGKGS